MDWLAAAAVVERTVRAYDPKPGAWTTRGDAEVRLFGARLADRGAAAPGTIISVDDKGIVVACGEGAVRIEDVHPAGRKRQRAPEWLGGRGAAVGDVLGAP